MGGAGTIVAWRAAACDVLISGFSHLSTMIFFFVMHGNVIDDFFLELCFTLSPLCFYNDFFNGGCSF